MAAKRNGPSADGTEAACVGTPDRGATGAGFASRGSCTQVNKTKSLAHELFQQPRVKSQTSKQPRSRQARLGH
jgi:hypothetical protein